MIRLIFLLACIFPGLGHSASKEEVGPSIIDIDVGGTYPARVGGMVAASPYIPAFDIRVIEPPNSGASFADYEVRISKITGNVVWAIGKEHRESVGACMEDAKHLAAALSARHQVSVGQLLGNPTVSIGDNRLHLACSFSGTPPLVGLVLEIINDDEQQKIVEAVENYLGL